MLMISWPGFALTVAMGIQATNMLLMAIKGGLILHFSHWHTLTISAVNDHQMEHAKISNISYHEVKSIFSYIINGQHVTIIPDICNIQETFLYITCIFIHSLHISWRRMQAEHLIWSACDNILKKDVSCGLKPQLYYCSLLYLTVLALK